MARKSRYDAENTMIDTAPAFNAWGYVRLSMQDKEDDSSIVNQELMVRKYIEQRHDLKLGGVFKDNGITGTNFQRPGFEALMDGIRSGKINCVVVKDLSRFGRDYIETGNYIEIIFPNLGVRFISIGDNYDSFDPRSTTDGMSIALKNMINAYYAKDISSKLRAAFFAKRQRGDFYGSQPPFGYVRMPGDKNKLAIDEETAAIVRDIFRWRIEGATFAGIAKRLSDAGIPNPFHYAYLIGTRNDKRYTEPLPWQSSTVGKILNNITYAGHLALGKKIAVAMHERVRQPKEKWVIKYNTHEPIITQVDFDAVLEMTQKGIKRCRNRWEKRKGAPLPENIFKGILFCGVCGYSFGRKSLSDKSNEDGDRIIYYTCTTCQKRGIRKTKYISFKVLSVLILEMIKAQLMACVKTHELAEKIRRSDGVSQSIADRKKEIGDIRRKMANIESGRERLLCDHYDDLLSEDEYKMIKDKREAEYVELQTLLEALLTEQESYKPGYWDKKQYITEIKKFIDGTELTRELLVAFVERIEIIDEKNIHISWKFQDDYAEVCGFVSGNGGEIQ